MDQPIRLQFEVVVPPEAIQILRQIISARNENQEKEQRRVESSRHAIYGSQKPPEDESLLVDTREVAKLLKCSSRTVFKMQTDGAIPAPIRIGRAVRWNRAELTAWIDAGCPAASEWKYPQNPN